MVYGKCKMGNVKCKIENSLCIAAVNRGNKNKVHR
jgi:hypothetical protein